MLLPAKLAGGIVTDSLISLLVAAIRIRHLHRILLMVVVADMLGQ